MTPRKASLIKSNKIRKNKDNKTDDKSHEGAKKVKVCFIFQQFISDLFLKRWREELFMLTLNFLRIVFYVRNFLMFFL